MPQNQRSSLETMLEMYSAGTPGTLQGVNSFLSEYGKNELPGYSDIFTNFRGNVERELNRGAAGLREAFGLRGARVGSDLLRAESALRQEGAQRIIGGAANLRSAAAGEAAQLGGLALSSAELENRIREAAFNRVFADYLRRTGVPPLLSQFAQFALGLGGPAGQPTTVIS